MKKLYPEYEKASQGNSEAEILIEDTGSRGAAMTTHESQKNTTADTMTDTIANKQANTTADSVICAEHDFQEGEELKTLCETVKRKLRENSFPDAESLIIAAMEQFPESPVPHNLYGLVLENRRKHPQAMKHFRAAYALDPTYAPAKHNMEVYGGMNSLGRAAYKTSDCRKKQPGIFAGFNVIFMRALMIIIPI